jgi:hypothetical protein
MEWLGTELGPPPAVQAVGIWAVFGLTAWRRGATTRPVTAPARYVSSLGSRGLVSGGERGIRTPETLWKSQG